MKRLSKDLDEMRDENRELIEGLAERLTEALERQAESNRALTETLESYLKNLDRDVPEREAREQETDGGSDEDQDEETDGQDEEPEEQEVTEAAERKAGELGVDLGDVKGTGSGGRILVKDVEEATG